MMNRQHSIRRNQRRERQKSLKHQIAANRACFEFLRQRLQVDIDDDNGEGAQDVQITSSQD
jgi:hypothetical protein